MVHSVSQGDKSTGGKVIFPVFLNMPRCGGNSGTQSIQFTEILYSVPVEE